MGVDGELEAIKNFGLKLARDPYVQLFSYVQEPLDRYDLENTVKLVRNIRAQYTDNPFIEDFYIYYGSSDRVANSNGFYQSKDYYRLEWSCQDQDARQWKRMLQTRGQSGFYPAALMVNGGKQGTYIPYLYNFGSTQEDRVTVQALLEQLRDYLRNILQIRVSVGVGTVCGRRGELNLSYKRAKDALDYCFIAGESSVIVYNDLEKPEKHRPYYPDKKIEKIIAHAIIQQDSSACEAILDEFYRDALSRQITVAEGRHLQIFLTDLAMKLIAKSGAVGKREEFCQDLIGKMLNCDTLPDIIPQMKTLLNCLCQEPGGSENRLGAEAVQFIKDNYRNSNLSLQLCAEVFKVTPEHLSRTIKMESGKTFMEIVNYLRIEHAKLHLMQSDKKMEEIAGLSGFGTTKSFFRSFKQAEGVPPGVWRKMDHADGSFLNK